MGVKNIYDRRPFLILCEYGIKKSKHFAKELGGY